MIFWLFVIITIIVVSAFTWAEVDRDTSYSYSMYHDDPSPIGVFFGSLILCGAFFGFILAIMCSMFGDAERVQTLHESHQVAALNDSADIEGEFHGALFFSSGYINTRLFWRWYEEQPDGTLEPMQISEKDGNDVVVHLIPDGEEPRVEHYDYEDITRNPDWLAPFDGWAFNDGDETDVWDLYIPRGSILHEAELDAR